MKSQRLLISVLLVAACDASAPAGGGGPVGFEGEAAGAEEPDGQVGDAGSEEGEDGGPVVVDEDVVIEVDDGDLPCHPTTCADKLLECGDCVDNDGDGVTDSRDLDCLGPCDNTEGPGLSSGVGGVNRANCGIDCYFDFGNGPGNDDCQWDHRCDPLEPEARCVFDETRLGSRDCPVEQSSRCDDVCRPFTPNGCDCFGCCTFEVLETAGVGGGPAHVWIGKLDENNESVCTFDAITDETKCPRCTPVESCFNDCGRCEVCIGKPTVPEDCFDDDDVPEDGEDPQPDGQNNGGDDPGGNSDQCPEGDQPCGQPGQEDCERNFYCITGCCQYID